MSVASGVADPEGPDPRVWGARLSNWGRWGPEDELGTLNHITADKRRDAAALVRRGAVFSLQIPMGRRGPMTGGNRVNPIHTMTATGTDDTQAVAMAHGAHYSDDVMFLYLQSGTEWDALAHVFYDGQLYNGFSAAEVDSRGAHRVGIDKAASELISRGVLLDAARARGQEALDPAVRLTGADLDAVAAAHGVGVGAGDIVVVRTGVMVDWARTGRWGRYHGPHPGLALEALEWCQDHRIAALAADNGAVEGFDARTGSPVAIPLHMVALRDMGLPLGESFYVEDLAEDCAADGVYEFLLAAQALRVEGGAGSPVNPIAMK